MCGGAFKTELTYLFVCIVDISNVTCPNRLPAKFLSQLMTVVAIKLIRPDSSDTSMSPLFFFPPYPNCQEIPVDLTFKIQPESNHFSPSPVLLL